MFENFEKKKNGKENAIKLGFCLASLVYGIHIIRNTGYTYTYVCIH